MPTPVNNNSTSALPLIAPVQQSRTSNLDAFSETLKVLRAAQQNIGELGPKVSEPSKDQEISSDHQSDNEDVTHREDVAVSGNANTNEAEESPAQAKEREDDVVEISDANNSDSHQSDDQDAENPQQLVAADTATATTLPESLADEAALTEAGDASLEVKLPESPTSSTTTSGEVATADQLASQIETETLPPEQVSDTAQADSSATQAGAAAKVAQAQAEQNSQDSSETIGSNASEPVAEVEESTVHDQLAEQRQDQQQPAENLDPQPEQEPGSEEAKPSQRNESSSPSTSAFSPEASELTTTEAKPDSSEAVDAKALESATKGSNTEAALAGETAPSQEQATSHSLLQQRLSSERTGLSPATNEPQDPGPRVDAGRFLGRVTRAFQAAEQRGGTIQLRLSPPELGAMKIELSVQQGTLTAKLETETAAAKSVLLDNLPALRERLAAQDIRVDKFDVDVQQQGSEANPDWQAGEREQGAGQRGTPASNSAHPGNDSHNTPTQQTDNTQIAPDGRLNIVA